MDKESQTVSGIHRGAGTIQADPAFTDERLRSEDLEFWIEIQESEIPQVAEKVEAVFGYVIRSLMSLERVEEYFLA